MSRETGFRQVRQRNPNYLRGRKLDQQSPDMIALGQ